LSETDAFERLGPALAIGLRVGVERGWQGHTAAAPRSSCGWRRTAPAHDRRSRARTRATAAVDGAMFSGG